MPGAVPTYPRIDTTTLIILELQEHCGKGRSPILFQRQGGLGPIDPIEQVLFIGLEGIEYRLRLFALQVVFSCRLIALGLFILLLFRSIPRSRFLLARPVFLIFGL